MSPRLIDHLWILMTVAFATYSQLVLKWQMNEVGALPADLAGKAVSLLQALVRPWVLTALFATFLSGICWMVALTKFDLSYAFPFTGLSFILMFAAGALVFGEQTSLTKLLGTLLVLAGLLVLVLRVPGDT